MELLGLNAGHGRDHNRRVVLAALRRLGRASRAELTRLTGLSAQAISNIVAALEDERLVRPAGRLHGARGQPPRQVALNAAGGVTLGIEIRTDALAAVVADLGGALRAQAEAPLRRADPGGVRTALPPLLAALRRAAPQARRPLGIGVVMPASVPAARPGAERPTELPGWDGVPDPAALLNEALRAEVGDAPLLLGTDATAAAIAEHLHGAGRAFDRIAVVYAGRGLGLGLILDGRAYRGAHGMAGEIGHLVVEPGGRPCPCGQRGCLERYASLDAAMAELGGAEGTEPPDWPGFDAWLDGAAPHLARAVVMVETLLDVERVILCGLSEGLVAALAERLAALPPGLVPRPGPRVLRGVTGPLCAARGAAALPLYDATVPAPAGRARPGRAPAQGDTDGRAHPPAP